MVFAPLDSLERLTDPYAVPGSDERKELAASLESPFHFEKTFTSCQVLAEPSLFSWCGGSYVAVINEAPHPSGGLTDEIIFLNLTDGVKSRMTCARTTEFNENVSAPNLRSLRIC